MSQLKNAGGSVRGGMHHRIRMELEVDGEGNVWIDVMVPCMYQRVWAARDREASGFWWLEVKPRHPIGGRGVAQPPLHPSCLESVSDTYHNDFTLWLFQSEQSFEVSFLVWKFDRSSDIPGGRKYLKFWGIHGGSKQYPKWKLNRKIETTLRLVQLKVPFNNMNEHKTITHIGAFVYLKLDITKVPLSVSNNYIIVRKENSSPLHPSSPATPKWI